VVPSDLRQPDDGRSEDAGGASAANGERRGERWGRYVWTVSEAELSELVTSVRQAAAVCNVSAPVVRRWLSLGLIPPPPWTLKQLEEVRGLTDPEGHRRGSRAAHGTMARWNAGCSCAECRQFQSDEARAHGRRKAQERLPAEVRQQFLDAIYDGKPFRQSLRDLSLTPNQVWGSPDRRKRGQRRSMRPWQLPDGTT
jgi:hypothetical protein